MFIDEYRWVVRNKSKKIHILAISLNLNCRKSNLNAIKWREIDRKTNHVSIQITCGPRKTDLCQIQINSVSNLTTIRDTFWNSQSLWMIVTRYYLSFPTNRQRKNDKADLTTCSLKSMVQLFETFNVIFRLQQTQLTSCQSWKLILERKQSRDILSSRTKGSR